LTYPGFNFDQPASDSDLCSAEIEATCAYLDARELLDELEHAVVRGEEPDFTPAHARAAADLPELAAVRAALRDQYEAAEAARRAAALSFIAL
jgi:hypothetical protein